MPWVQRDKYEKLLHDAFGGQRSLEIISRLRANIREQLDELKVAREQLQAERVARDLALHTMIAGKTGVILDPPRVPSADEVIDPHEEVEELAEEIRSEIRTKGMSRVMADYNG